MNSKILIVACAFVLYMGCQSDNEDPSGYDNIRWADSVIAFSTQYDTVNWSAHQALDAPNTYPEYGDIETAWTSEERDFQREYLELGYNADPQPIRSIAIFETYNPGFVDTVYVRNPMTNLWEVVYQDSARDAGDSSRIFIINFPPTSFNVSAIRIAIDEARIIGWNEIDAVGISYEMIPPASDTAFWAPILHSSGSVASKAAKMRYKK